MKPPFRAPWKLLVIFGASVLFLAVLALWGRSPAPGAQAAADLHTVWQQAQQAGRYRFNADITQRTIPLPSLANVGRASKDTRMHLEGDNNLPEQRMELSIWNQGGSLLDPSSALRIQVDGGQAVVSKGGQEWRTEEDLTSLFAPGGDLLAFLKSARQNGAPAHEQRAGLDLARYTFEIDGPAFASYMQQALQERLESQGKLPPGLQIDAPQVYAGMTGSGELWVGIDGYPVRQKLHLDFPPASGADYRMQAVIDITFSNFPQLVQAPTLASTLHRFISNLPFAEIAVLLLLSGLAVLIVLYGRSRKVQTAITLAFIAAMLLTPLLQSMQVKAFYDGQLVGAKQTGNASSPTSTLSGNASLPSNLNASPSSSSAQPALGAAKPDLSGFQNLTGLAAASTSSPAVRAKHLPDSLLNVTTPPANA